MKKEMMNFTAEQKTLVDSGYDIYKNYMYAFNNKSGEFTRFSNFDSAVSYEEKNVAFNSALIAEAREISGYGEDKFTLSQAIRKQSFTEAMFAVVETILDKIISKTEVEQFMTFAEVKTVDMGSSASFHVAPKSLYLISDVSNGRRRTAIQSVANKDFTLTPNPKSATVGFSMYDIVTGTVNWGAELARIAQSFITKISTDVVNIMFSQTLLSPWNYNAYAQADFIEMAERVEGANNAQGSTVYGTKTALGKILPTNQYFGFQKGSEFMDMGYIQNPFGVQVVRLIQAVNPNSDYAFAIPNDKVICLPNVGDKPVKIVLEGETEITPADVNENANKTMEYTITKRWAIGIVTQSNFAIMTV